MNLFNILQDMRHVIILDLREEVDFNQSHIRKSIRVTLENYKDEIMTAMLTKDKEKQQQFKSQYENDDLRRVVFIIPSENFKALEAQVNAEILAVDEQIDMKSGGLIQIHRVFAFKDYDTIFEPKYPLMCVQESSSQKHHV